MSSRFFILVELEGKKCRFSCEMMGMHYHVVGKNKSVLISQVGELMAGELKAEHVSSIYQAIQEKMRPAQAAKAASIQTRKKPL